MHSFDSCGIIILVQMERFGLSYTTLSGSFINRYDTSAKEIKMNKCFNCEKETMNPKFCSRNCSAVYNNKKFPKRLKEGQCVCGKIINSSRTYCTDCAIKFRRTKHPSVDNYRYVKGSRAKNKLRAVLEKGGKCSICGYSKCIRALEFHHLNPEEKSFTVSQNLNKAWKLLEMEIGKCVLLCANCHAEVESGMTII